MVKFGNKVIYFIGIVIAIIVFITGFLLGVLTVQSRYADIEDFETKLKIDAYNFDIQYLLLQEEPCKFIENPFNNELYVLAEELINLENERGFENKDVIRLKDYYSMLEIRNWIFLKTFKEKCGKDYVLNLYFYSNKDCEKCIEQGKILTSLRQKYPKIRTYSFDINIDNKALTALKQLYNVKEVPTVVFDDITFSGFRTEEELEKALINSLK
jgi:hypothetical protein